MQLECQSLSPAEQDGGLHDRAMPAAAEASFDARRIRLSMSSLVFDRSPLLPAIDRNGAGRVEAKLDPTTLDGNDDDFNILADHDSLIGLAAENEHSKTILSLVIGDYF